MTYYLPLKLLSIQGDGYHLLAEATINDTPVSLLVDTGASRTVFDLDHMRSLLNLTEEQIEQNEGPSGGIGSTDLESSITVIPCLNLGGCEFHHYQTALIDLAHVNTIFSAICLPHVDGIIGGDLLQTTSAKIDYKKLVLTLHTPKKNRKKHYHP
ncbi:MAG: retropepsin-like aspartic protease [Bacteroidetes bacterium]|nr:retropepsin-like aspartic protease [Bacteroidota bacterium]